jgi:DNA-binding response OmpR family regulator
MKITKSLDHGCPIDENRRGDDSFFNSRNLDVYVTKLRDYFKEDPTIEIITIKGVGYHFAVGH